jgi:hypothetical protein
LFVPTVPTSTLFHILYQAFVLGVILSSKNSKNKVQNLGTVGTVGTPQPINNNNKAAVMDNGR